MHVCTNGRTPKSYNHVWSGHDGKGCVFGCGLCSGMYCDTYVFMYMNMQTMFELSLQAAAPYFNQILVPIIILIRNMCDRTSSKQIHDHWRESIVWRECEAQPISIQAQGHCVTKPKRLVACAFP